MRPAPRIIAAIAAAFIATVSVAACSGASITAGQRQEQQSSQQDLTTFEQVQPAPHFPYSVLREVGIDVEASQALGEETTSFFFAQGDPDPIYSCPSIGQPFQATAQITNPNQLVPDPYNTYHNQDPGSVVIGNIDPNGVYSPPDSTGTNVLCVNASGQKYLFYWEGFVAAINGTATWNYTTHRMNVTGGVNMPTCKTANDAKGKPQTTCVK